MSVHDVPEEGDNKRVHVYVYMDPDCSIVEVMHRKVMHIKGQRGVTVFDSVDDLPLWIQEKIAVLWLLDGSGDVEGVGECTSEGVERYCLEDSTHDDLMKLNDTGAGRDDEYDCRSFIVEMGDNTL